MRRRLPEAERWCMGYATTTEAACPACGSNEIMALSMLVAESALRFTCCIACEHRWWEREGTSIPLDSVLSLVATR
jgi:formate dehydrogenase maturation protein FdhE